METFMIFAPWWMHVLLVLVLYLVVAVVIYIASWISDYEYYDDVAGPCFCLERYRALFALSWLYYFFRL